MSNTDTRLTRREREVMNLIGQGLRGRDAAERLGIAYFTLRKHRANILRKLGLTGSAQLSAAAVRMFGGHPSRRQMTAPAAVT